MIQIGSESLKVGRLSRIHAVLIENVDVLSRTEAEHFQLGGLQEMNVKKRQVRWF